MYIERNIKFKELLRSDEWKIKAYTISKSEVFGSLTTYNSIHKSISAWLQDLNSFDPSHENISFLILHEASEGVFCLINTWVGSNMLQTHIYLSKYDSPEHFEKISGDGLFACVWELEVINHERNSWIKHILKQPESPDYNAYIADTLTVIF